MIKILVSACLLGEKVRFDGKDKKLSHDIFEHWQAEGRLVSICPEMAGGLPTPRDPSEIVGEKVLSNQGKDVTAQFKQGAEAALSLCRQHGIKIAILKARSPSCGNGEIYNGTFSGTIIEGQGVTARLLITNGIAVYNENEIPEAQRHLLSLTD